jgi:hypothetical protein
MAIFTLTEVEEQITAWKAALLAVSLNQSYMIGDKRLTRADLPQIRQTLEWLDKEKTRITEPTGIFVNGPEIRRP